MIRDVSNPYNDVPVQFREISPIVEMTGFDLMIILNKRNPHIVTEHLTERHLDVRRGLQKLSGLNDKRCLSEHRDRYDVVIIFSLLYSF